MSRSRRFAFTQHDITFDYSQANSKASFVIYGKETCPTTKKEHYQGYIEFKEAKTISAVSKLIKGAHIEVAKGTSQDNIIYCTKEDKNAKQIGTPSKQGERKDLEEIQVELETKTIEEIADTHFSKWCQYGRQFKEYKALKEVKRDWIPEVILLYGETGTGKTKQAIEAGGVILEYTTGGFINGYNGEDVVIFDDVDINTLPPRTTLLKLLDRYPYSINIKGGTRNWKPKVIYFTSNYDPDELLITSDPALNRRFTQLIEVKKNE